MGNKSLFNKKKDDENSGNSGLMNSFGNLAIGDLMNMAMKSTDLKKLLENPDKLIEMIPQDLIKEANGKSPDEISKMVMNRMNEDPDLAKKLTKLVHSFGSHRRKVRKGSRRSHRRKVRKGSRRSHKRSRKGSRGSHKRSHKARKIKRTKN